MSEAPATLAGACRHSQEIRKSRFLVAMAWLDVHCDFSELALLKARLKELQADIGQEQFGADGVDLTFRLPRTRVDEASLLVSDISRGRSVARPLD